MKQAQLQEKAFLMIGIIGQAKHQALAAYREFKLDQNKKTLLAKLKRAEQKLGEVGQIHMAAITQEAQGKKLEFSGIFMHAEDQFMTVQMMIEILQIISE